MTTGRRIQQARKQAKLTQAELGAKLGVSGSMIGQYENDLRNPKYDTLSRIADTLGVLLVDLLDEETAKVYQKGFIQGAAAESVENDIIDKLWKQEGYSGSDTETQLINAFSQLNEKGQQIAVERVEELTKIPDYQRTETPTDTP